MPKSPKMMIWEKRYPTCTHEARRDLCKGKSKYPNELCYDCETHWFKGKEYNPDQWDEYVNDV